MRVIFAERFEGRQARLIPVFVLGKGRGHFHDRVPLGRRQPGQLGGRPLRTGEDMSFMLMAPPPSPGPFTGPFLG